MEVQEMVKYGNRIVKARWVELVNPTDELKPDNSLADEYDRLGFKEQSNLARKEARVNFVKKLGFKQLSEDEIFTIGVYYANKIKRLKWGIENDDGIGGIISGFVLFKNRWKVYQTYRCNPWCEYDIFDTELIPIQILKRLKEMNHLFDGIYIASTSRAEKTFDVTKKVLIREYESPVAVGKVENRLFLLARWGDYPKWLDKK